MMPLMILLCAVLIALGLVTAALGESFGSYAIGSVLYLVAIALIEHARDVWARGRRCELEPIPEARARSPR